MCRVETIVLAAVLLVECGALHMYPEIFDPAKFLQRPLPLKAPSGRSASPVASGGGAESNGGFKDGEVGFVRSSSESGKGGYRHRENFHKKDGNQYGHEKQTGFGETKRTGEQAADGKDQHGRLMVHTDHYRPEPTYEVTEEQSDVENPDKHKKYGGAGQQDEKRPTTAKPEKKASRQRLAASAPKDRSKQKKNHNGYESIVYHENERDSSEHGYGKRKITGKLPIQKPAKQMAAENDDDEEGFGAAAEGHSSAERDYDHAYEGDSDGADAGRESDFDDNYESVRFDTDFERAFGSEEHEEGEAGEGNGKGSGRTEARQDQGYDYDEEVDRDEVDESANEDKYRGGEDSEEEDGDDRQYEYASEADGEAQDY